MKTTAFIRTALLAATVLVSVTANSYAWWNKDWTARRPVTIDTTKTGFEISEPVGTAASAAAAASWSRSRVAASPDRPASHDV